MSSEERRFDKILMGVVAILILSNVAVPAYMLFTQRSESFAIRHEPIEYALVGEPIQIGATIDGGKRGVGQVILFYKDSSMLTWQNATLGAIAPGSSNYITSTSISLKSKEMNYQICASDNLGQSSCTRIFTILARDFALDARINPVIYPGTSSVTEIFVRSLNGFASPVIMHVEMPNDLIKASFEPGVLTPQVDQPALAKLTFFATDQANPDEYRIRVVATSGRIEHSFWMSIWIPDFEIAANPSKQAVTAKEFATFRVDIRPVYGFNGRIDLSLTAPAAVSWFLSMRSVNVPAETTVILIVKSDNAGIYFLQLQASARGQTRTLILILTVNQPST